MEENNTNNPNTSSFQEVTSSLTVVSNTDRLCAVLIREIEALKAKVYNLETKKIIDETQLPPEILIQNGMFPSIPQKLKRGLGSRPLLRSEIIEAIVNSKSAFCTDQAKYLGVAVSTYRKYAKQHGLWNPSPTNKGCKKPWGPEKGKYPLSKIFAGEMNDNPRVTDWIVKPKLLMAKIFPEECAICGYNKRHMITKRPILLIDHMDGDVHNYKKDNLRLLCVNCTIECARGYFRRGIHKFDPTLLPLG